MTTKEQYDAAVKARREAEKIIDGYEWQETPPLLKKVYSASRFTPRIFVASFVFLICYAFFTHFEEGKKLPQGWCILKNSDGIHYAVKFDYEFGLRDYDIFSSDNARFKSADEARRYAWKIDRLNKSHSSNDVDTPPAPVGASWEEVECKR